MFMICQFRQSNKSFERKLQSSPNSMSRLFSNVVDQRVPGEAGGSGERWETCVSCRTQHPRYPAQEHDGQREATAVRLPQLRTCPRSPRLGPGERLKLSMLSYVS